MRGVPPLPKLAHVKIFLGVRFPKAFIQTFYPPPHRLQLCQSLQHRAFKAQEDPPDIQELTPHWVLQCFGRINLGCAHGPAARAPDRPHILPGYDSKTPGTPGTTARICAKSLPCFVFSVPGRTGDRPSNTGDTGDNSFRQSAQQFGQPMAPPVLGAWCTLRRPCAARSKPRHRRPSAARSAQGCSPSPAAAGRRAGAHTSSSKMVGVMR